MSDDPTPAQPAAPLTPANRFFDYICYGDHEITVSRAILRTVDQILFFFGLALIIPVPRSDNAEPQPDLLPRFGIFLVAMGLSLFIQIVLRTEHPVSRLVRLFGIVIIFAIHYEAMGNFYTPRTMLP